MLFTLYDIYVMGGIATLTFSLFKLLPFLGADNRAVLAGAMKDFDATDRFLVVTGVLFFMLVFMPLTWPLSVPFVFLFRK